MKRIYVIVALCSMGAILNLPLLIRDEEILISNHAADGGWKVRCIYYSPFELRSVDIPSYQSCPRVRQEGGNRRSGSFFWERRA